MLPKFSTLLLAFSAAALGAVQAPGQTMAPSRAANGPDNDAIQLVVLKNGEVLRGNVRSTRDRFMVTLPGREISLRHADVDVVASSLKEAYGLKRAKIGPTDIAGGLELAGWCLRHSLYDQAAAELASIRTRQPHDPRLVQLDRRLQRELAARENSESKNVEPIAAAGGAAETTQPFDAPTAADRRVGKADRFTSWPPIAASAAGHATSRAGGNRNAPAWETPANLERFVRSLPTEAVEQFTGTIQPLIVNGCAAAACHAPASGNNFALLRLSPGIPATRRLTQRNLYNTAQLVDFSDPPASRLLKLARQPHGPLKAGVFGDEQSPKYRDLERWIANLTRTKLDRPQGSDDAEDGIASTRERPPRTSVSRRGTSGKDARHFPGSVQQATYEAAESMPPAVAKRNDRKSDKSKGGGTTKNGDEPTGSAAKNSGTPSPSATNRWPPLRDTPLHETPLPR